MRVERDDLPLVVAVLAELVVLALLPRLVTVDGPAHVLGGWVLAHPHDPLLRHFYEIDLTPVPNLLASVLLAGLLRLSGPDVAEKLLVAGYVVLFPLGLRAALRAVEPRAGWLAVLAVPLTPAYLLTYGFYDLFLGLALSMAVAAVALRRRSGWTPRATGGLAVLLLLTWSAHLLPLLVVGLLVAVLGVTRALADPAPRKEAARRHLLPVVLAGLPVLVLTVRFGLSDAGARGAPQHDGLLDLLGRLVSMWGPIVAYSAQERWPALAVALVLLGLLVRAVRHGEGGPERRALAVTLGLVTVAYFVLPERYGPDYGFLNDRLSLFPPLLLALWAAPPPPSPAVRRAVVSTLLGSALAVGLLRIPTESRYQREVAELMSLAPSVPHGSVLLKVQLWRDPPSGGHVRNRYRDALRHEVGRLAVVTGGVDAGHYEAALDYFPERFRASTNPRVLVDPTGEGLYDLPPQIDLRAAEKVVDVIILLGRGEARPDVLAQAAPVLADLQASYREVAISRPTGLAEVWVRR